MNGLPLLTCRKCGKSNPLVYLGPVALDGTGTCICLDCAKAQGWMDRDGNLKEGISV